MPNGFLRTEALKPATVKVFVILTGLNQIFAVCKNLQNACARWVVAF